MLTTAVFYSLRKSNAVRSHKHTPLTCVFPPEGPCLIHSMNGDLLRTLDAPEPCVRPRLIHSSTEGHCMVYYDKGHFCLFSVNGKMLGHLEVEDNIRVREIGRAHV